MWILIILGMLLSTAAGGIFLILQLASLMKLRRPHAVALSAVIVCAGAAAACVLGGMMNMLIIFIHLLVCWLLSALLWKLVRRGKDNRKFTAATALAVCLLWLGLGAYNALHVSRAQYTIPTSRMSAGSSLRIVGFSDSHVGTTFHGEKLGQYVREMNAEAPDIVVIVGDYVDDDTSYEDMVRSCEELGGLQARYGVYYVFGNHDAGYYAGKRGYGKAELAAELERNGVRVLEDETVPLFDNVLLIGRQDAQQRSRMTMADYGLTADTCAIVLDHQPNDYAAQTASGAALVISGHTHGGQFFPINYFGEWFGLNELTYGLRKTGGTNFIVSSGIADWAFAFKTGCRSEYFVIDLVGE